MDESFYKSRADQEIKALMPRSDGPALVKFGIQYSLLLGSAAVVAFGVGGWWAQWPAIFVFALMTMAMFATVHETAHNTAFASRALNQWVCWLAAVPIYYTPTAFREFHFAHHRHTHDPLRDPEIAFGGKVTPTATSHIGIYLVFLSGLPVIFYKVGLLFAASAGGPQAIWSTFLFYVTPKARQKLIWEARTILAFHVLWVVAGLLWLPGLLALLIAQVIGHFFLALYITAEHNGLPHEGDIFTRTRTTDAHPFIKWLMWNMPYHAEHHAYPAIPWHALPRLHAILEPELKHTIPNYRTFHKRVLGALAHGKPYQESDPIPDSPQR